MARDKNSDLSQEERVRQTPETGAEADRNTRERSSELPADPKSDKDLQARLEAANKVANQTIGEGNKQEVQGRLAVPTTRVMKRGSTKFTDKDGNIVKTLNDAQVNATIGEDAEPDYLKLHQEVLDGKDPIKATLRFQDRKPEEQLVEGNLKNAEEHPRTGGLGVATSPENVQRTEEDTE